MDGMSKVETESRDFPLKDQGKPVMVLLKQISRILLWINWNATEMESWITLEREVDNIDKDLASIEI